MSLHDLEVQDCFCVKLLSEDHGSNATLGTKEALLAAVLDCKPTWSCCVSVWIGALYED